MRMAEPAPTNSAPAAIQRKCAACEDDESAGALALGSPSERFHWLTAPRSDVIQSGAVHEGVCVDPSAELETLFREIVRP